MSILIRNVKVLGGPEGLPERSDVFVSGGSISAIGNFTHKSADEVIDGQGAYLSAGFIDIDSTSDHYLTIFSSPEQESSLKQGVTTIIGGHCGASLAPLLYGDLEGIRKWGDPSKLNVDWHTLGELLPILEKRQFGVNFGTFAGHSTIRRAMVGDENRELTKNELAVMSNIVSKAMAEGAFGLSLGLEYLHSRGTSYGELKDLAKNMAAAGRPLSIHLRHTGVGILKAVEEILRLREETGVAILITHFVPMKGSEKEFKDSLDLISKLPEEADLHMALYPFAGVILSLYQLLPEWVQNGNLELMAKSVGDAWLSKRILKELPVIEPSSLIIEASRNPVLPGKSLKEFMAFSGIEDPQSGLLELMRATRLNSVISWENVDQELLDATLGMPRTLIGSHSAAFPANTGSGLHTRRSRETFTAALQKAKDETELRSRVRSMTELPAKKLGLTDRGLIREGYAADIVVFKDGEAKQVIVNGKISVKDGSLVAATGGKILRRA